MDGTIIKNVFALGEARLPVILAAYARRTTQPGSMADAAGAFVHLLASGQIRAGCSRLRLDLGQLELRHGGRGCGRVLAATSGKKRKRCDSYQYLFLHVGHDPLVSEL